LGLAPAIVAGVARTIAELAASGIAAASLSLPFD